EQIVRLLIDRELIVEDKKGVLQVVQNASVRRAFLVERIALTMRQLEKLDAEIPESQPDTDSIKILQTFLNDLQRRLDLRVEEQTKEISETANSLRGLIGTVLAMTLVADWSPTELSIHFTGVTAVLTETKNDLIKSLRKELKRIE